MSPFRDASRVTFCAWSLTLTLVLTSAGVPAHAQSGEPPTHVRALVTGDPATPAFITTRIDAALARALEPALQPGEAVQVSEILPAPAPLERGFETSFTVRSSIVANAGATAATTTTIVDVINVDLPRFAPRTLAFRDDPERIIADGVLSRTTVDAEHPLRVYYYHQNMQVRRRFCVVLSVRDSVRSRIQIVGASAGPNIDVMSVGHAVSKTFLARQPRDEGSVVEIAGGKPLLERDEPAEPGEGIVGALDLRVLAGGPLTMTVMAIPVAADPVAYLYTDALPRDGHDRHGDFDLTDFGQAIIAYTAGGPDAAYVYGLRRRTPPGIDPADRGRDYGDYGVLQHITFDLANPSAVPVRLFLYEKPLGGVVRSSFLVDGALIDVGCVRVAQRYAVTSTTVQPGATAALEVLTMTDGGSNYPLEIGLTAQPPSAQLPAISAPDGCFPKPAAPRS